MSFKESFFYEGDFLEKETNSSGEPCTEGGAERLNPMQCVCF